MSKREIIRSIYENKDGFQITSNDGEYTNQFQEGNYYFITTKIKPPYTQHEKEIVLLCGIYVDSRSENTHIDHYESIYTIYKSYHTFSNVCHIDTGLPVQKEEYSSDDYIFSEYRPRYLNQLKQYINTENTELYVLK
jgi:hypothetical protein